MSVDSISLEFVNQNIYYYNITLKKHEIIKKVIID